MGNATVAAIDCGTNSTRLLIVDGAGQSVERVMRITRLGQGVDAAHQLAAEAVARTVAVLHDFRALMDHHAVEAVRLVATSAVRDADNGREFLRQASEVVGAEAELLPGLEEGRLAFAGATADLAPVPGLNVVVDIGGGSTELVLAAEGSVHAVSMDVGCVRLSERFFLHDPPEPAELAGAATLIRAELDPAVTAVPILGVLPPMSRLLGLAGTVSTLSALQQGLVAYDRDRIHHSVITAAMAEHWCDTLATEPAAARAERPGMLDGRQDVIVGGALVLREVMHRFGFDRCTVSEADILDGLAMSLQLP